VSQRTQADENLRWVVWRRGEATLDEGEVVVEGRLRGVYVGAFHHNGGWEPPSYALRLEQARRIDKRDD
jgi:hypothetical protein